MARASLLVVLSFIAFPAVAQLTQRAPSTTRERDCYAMKVERTLDGGWIFDFSDMFALQADGTFRDRHFCPPLFRPSPHNERH